MGEIKCRERFFEYKNGYFCEFLLNKCKGILEHCLERRFSYFVGKQEKGSHAFLSR